ncbi:hypothetical protein [Sphingomonas metalli]|uniref:hypothetical protein n=1 Tax=Sphingomonas metalli TaxID=1779358 RepID=UPI0016694313|nr:hypothetical protein [Sphingomonas metalli]
MLLVQAAPSPPAEALPLARELAEAGTLATLLPMLIGKDLDDLAKERPGFTPEQQRQLRATGEAIAARRRGQVIDALATAYARRLSVADLRTLVAASRTPAARAKRAADVPVTMEAMATLGSIDLKKETAAQFCRDTRLFCDR